MVLLLEDEGSQKETVEFVIIFIVEGGRRVRSHILSLELACTYRTTCQANLLHAMAHAASSVRVLTRQAQSKNERH
jgi:hypothetical protein